MSSAFLKVRVRISGVLQAPILQTWEYVRIFGRAEVWNGYYKGAKIITALLPGQIDGQVGAVRTTAIGAASYVEQLDALDNESYTLKYKIVDHPRNTNPFPGSLFNFRSVIKLLEVTRGDATYMEWTGEFDTAPQEVGLMQAAVSELFEAGLDGLEALLQPAHAYAEADSLHPPVVNGQCLTELSRSLGSLNMRSTREAVMEPNPPFNAFQHQRAYMGPASVVSEPNPHAGRQGLQEAGSMSSLESSPHLADRPAGVFHNQWTSGGSGYMLPNMPKRVSAETADLMNKRHLHRHRSSRGEQDNSGSANANPYFGHPVQGSRHSASSLDSTSQAMGPDGQPQMPPLHKDLSVGTAVAEDVSLGLTESQFSDPVLLDREDFKNSLIKNKLTDVSSFSKDRRKSDRVSDRNRSLPGSGSKFQDIRTPDDTPHHPAAVSNLTSPNSQEEELEPKWTRPQQQFREPQPRETGHSDRMGRVPGYNYGPVPSGPFAAAAVSKPPIAMQRHASQQSIDSLAELMPAHSGETRIFKERQPRS